MIPLSLISLIIEAEFDCGMNKPEMEEYQKVKMGREVCF
jgi:hypothetical protein